jgi:UPF0716 family protein affecting phage T7 exclusion
VGFILFVLLPLTELYVLIAVGKQIGFWSLLGVLAFSAFVGISFAQREGLRVWSELQQDLLAGREPRHGALEGVLVLLGGVLLVIPGLISDVVGLLLLVPWTRHVVARALRHSRSKGGAVFSSQSFFVRWPPAPHASAQREARAPRPAGGVIDTTGEAVDDSEPPQLPR